MSRMSLKTAIQISAEVKGGANITKVQRSLQDLAKGSQTTAREMGTLRSATFQYARANDTTIAGIRNSVTAFRGLQEQAKIGSREFTRYGTEIQRLEGKLRGLDGTAQKAGASLGKNLATGLAAAGIGRALQGITMQAGRFDAELRKAAAIEGGAGSFGVLRKEIEAVAAAAAGTPTEVAELATALSRAGFSAKETTDSLRGIVLGAEATSVSFAEMGSIAADNMRAFGLQTNETGRVVDVLTQAANKSNQTVLDLGESMKYAAPIARTLGVPIDDLAGALGLLANNGIRGSDAGTALRTGLTRLQIAAGGADSEVANLTRGNAQLTKAMASLGSSILDTSGKLKPMDQVLIGLKQSFALLSTTDQAILAKALFGTEAGSKFQALLNSTEGSITSMFAATRNAGGVAAETRKNMEGFDFSIKVLGGNMEYLTNQIGDAIGVGLKPLIDFLNTAIGAAQKLPEPVKAIGSTAAAAGLLVLGLALAINTLKLSLGVVGSLRAYIATTAAAGNASAVAAGQVGTLGARLAAIGKIGIIVVGVSVVVNGISKLIEVQERLNAISNSSTEQFGAQVGGSALPRDNVDRLIRENRAEYQRRKKEFESVRFPGLTGQDEIAKAAMLQLDARLAKLESMRDKAPTARNAAGTPVGAVAGGGAVGAVAGGGAAGDDKKGTNQSVEGMKARADAEKKLRESQKEQNQAADGLLATESNRLKILQIADPLQRQIAEARIRELTILDEYNKRIEQVKAPGGDDQARQQTLATLQKAQQNALQANSLEMERELKTLSQDAMQPLQDAVREYGNRLAYEREYGGLLEKGINPELAKQYIEIDRIAEASRTNLELQIENTQEMLSQLPIDSELRKGLEERIKRQRELLGLVPDKAAEAKDDAKATDDVKSKRERDEAEAKARAERLKDLYKGIASTIRDGIVDAMQAGIDSLIDGSKRLDESLKEIASGVLKEISNALLRFAINSASKALFPKLFADGGVFGAGGVTAFASGGIVDSPTLFKFAQGGAMQNGLMGEAGPEAIMPLRRGADGRLGVDASGMAVPYQSSPAAATGEPVVPYQASPAAGATGGLTVPYQSSGTTLAVPFLKGGGGASGDGMAASIDVKFETVRIGNMDVVTREEAQRIGQEAAQRGAELASKRYRNSPSARRRDGIR